jgi:tetratricopeptide (TPR) repeat protein
VLFPENFKEVSINNPGNLELYLSLIDKETPSLLSQASLDAMLPLLLDFADTGRSGRVAAAWLMKGPSPDDPLWMPAQRAVILALAQNEPLKALGVLRGIDPVVRKKYDHELSLLELDLLVFYLRDPSAVLVANRIITGIPDPESIALAKIRIGDLYRLTDHFQEAVQIYQGIQKDISDQTGGRKIPAQDSAYSMTIEKLLTGGSRSQAMEKLSEWEIHHPMAKFDTDFLLLRARMLNAYGRWVEELTELDSFKKIQPESPYEIDADFYSAQALHALGKKEEARKLWSLIASKYPHHELAARSRELLLKP